MPGADLLELAVAAHGGAERFQRGKLADYEGRVSTAEPHVVFDPYPRTGQRGVLGATRCGSSRTGER